MKMLRRIPQVPALHSRHGPGRARLFPGAAILARRLRGQHREHGAVSGGPLRAGRAPACAAARCAPPVDYPDVGVYHPRMKGRYGERLQDLPFAPGPKGTVGVLMLRSYLLAGNAGHYDGVIAALEARGMRVIPAFASGLDSRPAIDKFFVKDGMATIDALVSLTGLLAGRRTRIQRLQGGRGQCWRNSMCPMSPHTARIPDSRSMGRIGTRAAAGRKHHHGRDPGARRRHGSDGVRRTPGAAGVTCTGCGRGCTFTGADSAQDMHSCPERATMLAARVGQARRAAPRRAGATQGRHRAVQLPAECRQYRHGRLPVGVRVAVPHARRR